MILKGAFLLFLGAGVFMLVQVAMPFLAFKAWEVLAYDQNQVLVDPLPLEKNLLAGSPGLGYSQILGVSIENVGNFPAFMGTGETSAPYKEFTLSVPNLGLSDIRVLINSNELSKTLAHLPSTALPGQKGNVFISGHSSISAALANTGTKAFFVNLSKLKKGDEIILTALGQRFGYKVVGMKIVDPKDVSVINPPDSEGRYVTLMTCVPPGFNTKRLVVLAQLAQ